MTTHNIHYFEYKFKIQVHYIAAYSLQQADRIYMFDVLAKEGIEERDMTRLMVSDERAEKLGLTKILVPGLIEV